MASIDPIETGSTLRTSAHHPGPDPHQPSGRSLVPAGRTSLRRSATCCVLACLITAGIEMGWTRTEAAAPVQEGTKLTWQGGRWNVTGVNMPWYNWGCDFGCNANGGVVGTRTTLASRFATLQSNGIHTVRWWVFPGANPWQITSDGTGRPTGIDAAVYADFDAALQLAAQYDLYFNFVLFSGATHPPRSWIDNPDHRAALGQVLGTLFARYRNNPRVMSWEIFNEPEFQIWNNEISEANTVATARVIADSVHANSDALVTLGNASAAAIPMWSTVNLDYYSPHWYDYMSGGGDWCMACNDHNYYKTRFGITKPMVAGEIYLGSDINPSARVSSFYDKGYAGVWGWSLFSDRTADGMTVDMPAMQALASSRGDIGPRGQAVPAPPTNLRITALLFGPSRHLWDRPMAAATPMARSRRPETALE